MSDITVKRIDEMAKTPNGFVLARASLGVSSFGMQVSNFPPGFNDYPEHRHENMTGEMAAIANDGQEEVYIPLEGRGTLMADGKEITLEPGMMVRCGPSQMRKIVTTDSPLKVLAIGAMPGKAYKAPAFTEIESRAKVGV
jgi:uncharacterized cupin superfamily protein